MGATRLPDWVFHRLRSDAEAIGTSMPALLTAELRRYWSMAEAAVPELTPWQWDLLGHVLSLVEGGAINAGIDTLPSASRIAAELDTWADDATDEEIIRADELRRQVLTWSPLTIAGVLIRLRGRS